MTPTPETRPSLQSSPLASEEGKEKDGDLQAHTAEKALRDIGDLLRNEKEQEAQVHAQALPGETRNAAAALLMQEMKAMDGKTLADQLNWFEGAASLRILAPQMMESWKDIILERMKAAIALIENPPAPSQKKMGLAALIEGAGNRPLAPHEKDRKEGLKRGDALTVLDERVHHLYKFLGHAPTDASKQLCIDTLLRWESNIRQMKSADVESFIGRQIEVSQKTDHEFLRPLMQSITKESLDSMTKDEKAKTLPSLFVEKEGKYFLISKNTDGKQRSWQVELHSEGAPLLYFRCTDPAEPGLVFSLDAIEDVLPIVEKNPLFIQETAERAVREYKAEHTQEYQEALRKYDLPSDRALAHVRLFPKEYNGIIAQSLHTSLLLSNTLQQRYGKNLTVRAPLFSGRPVDALREEVRAIVRENGGGPVHIVLDIFSHGQPKYFRFQEKMEAKDLVQLAKEFPQCTFTISTVACYGAGVVQGLEENQEYQKDAQLQKRLALFTQTKGTVPNLIGQSMAGSMYYMHFMRALSEGKSYGEAHRIADIEVKQYMPNDAEAIIDGKKLVMDKPMETGRAAA